MPHTYAYRWFVQAMVTIAGCTAGALGLAILAGGAARFTAPGFATARLIPGSWATWGVMFTAIGALTLLGAWQRHNAWIRVGLLAEAIGFLFFDLSLIATAFADPKGALTGCVIYAAFPAACLALWGAVKELT